MDFRELTIFFSFCWRMLQSYIQINKENKMPNFCSSPWIPVPVHPHWYPCHNSFAPLKLFAFSELRHSIPLYLPAEQWGRRYEHFYCFRLCRSSFQFNLLLRIFLSTSLCTSFFIVFLACTGIIMCSFIMVFFQHLMPFDVQWRAVE
jgi:hypothetical protein